MSEGSSSERTWKSIGEKTDAEATGDGSLIAILKRLRTLLGNVGVGALQLVDAQANNVDTTLAADLVTYTVPGGKTARLVGATCFPEGGGPTVQLQLVRGAATIILASSAAAQVFNTPVHLRVKWRCTAGAALTTADVTLSIEEQS